MLILLEILKNGNPSSPFTKDAFTITFLLFVCLESYSIEEVDTSDSEGNLNQI
jgi:hypothetical protein